jgi:hypothetical protein
MCLNCQNVFFLCFSLEVCHFTAILVFTSVLLYGCYYICAMKLFETWEWLITVCWFIFSQYCLHNVTLFKCDICCDIDMLDLGIETVSHNCFKVPYDMAWQSLDKQSSSKLKTPKKNLHVYHITEFSVYIYMILTLQYCECEIC